MCSKTNLFASCCLIAYHEKLTDAKQASLTDVKVTRLLLVFSLYTGLTQPSFFHWYVGGIIIGYNVHYTVRHIADERQCRFIYVVFRFHVTILGC